MRHRSVCVFSNALMLLTPYADIDAGPSEACSCLRWWRKHVATCRFAYAQFASALISSSTCPPLVASHLIEYAQCASALISSSTCLGSHLIEYCLGSLLVASHLIEYAQFAWTLISSSMCLGSHLVEYVPRLSSRRLSSHRVRTVCPCRYACTSCTSSSRGEQQRSRASKTRSVAFLQALEALDRMTS
jgi:hypothetical protein